MIKKITVCNEKTCASRGAEHILSTLQKIYSPKNIRVQPCKCTGHCEQGPNVVIDDEFIIHDARVSTIAEKIDGQQYKKMDKLTFEDIAKNDFLGDLF
jgi:NADH:ubiquinone oxidoreductase subunit E